ncbi:hypothetical protein PHISCL_06529 [Aspergillus sclerotialis]|uniref:Protein efr3 n=1 Tax=Aspergillus sclerotialis TaxID=2070753 RepID=A0A3A2ZP12_9EURO|nr:hypothetical protein PHISCL_06529 [Aspergillus sclerotialis]
MESVRQSCRPKHQVLTLKCYPRYQKGVQEVKPNSSELSYLLYYVSTRRSKLTKVGAFLEKRAARDVWRRRLGNVQVTLQILSALIEKLPRDLLIYARYVLTVIATVLQSNDISMVEDSIATFEAFCHHQDMAALAAEQEIAKQYREVVRTYAAFADANPSAFSKVPRSPPVTFRWRNAGLRAMRAVVSSEGLTADGGESLRIVLPVILENLYTGEVDVLDHLQSRLQEPETNEPDPARRRRVSVATVQTVDTANGDAALASQSAADVDRKAEMDVRLLALRCLERVVVSGSNRGQIRIATSVVLRFILSKGPIRAKEDEKAGEKGTTESWATSLIELIAKWCPVQVRFVILVAAMELLSEIHPTEKVLEKPFTIVYLIDWLVKSQVNMIGLSVMDVLLGLMRYISLLVEPENKGTTGNGASEKPDQTVNHAPVLSGQRKELLSLLQICIGNLTTHIYYGDQVLDLVKAILSRFKSSATHEPIAEEPSGQSDTATARNPEVSNNGFSRAPAKVAALKSITNILIVANLRRPMAAAGVESRDRIGIDAWDGTQWLLRAPEREVRYAYADAFLSWLKFETNKCDLKFKDENEKRSGSMRKREMPENSELSDKRNASSTVGPREQATLVTQSNFLRLLHLTIYDIALENSSEESEILLLHLLLTNLIENLGVNSVRFGLPMILKLQDDAENVDAQRSLGAKVNIASLGYGYLWALSEKFDLEVLKVGSEIVHEIERRRRLGLWFEKIRLPPVSLDNIIAASDTTINGDRSGSPSQLRPFRSSIQELVDRIEDSYNSSMSASSPSHSPPRSPTRNFGVPAFGHGMSSSTTQSSLPSSVKEQMLSSWSREACLAAVEQESAKAMSLNGSRAGNMAVRNHVQVNGDSTPSISYSPIYAHQGDAAGTGAGASPAQFRRESVSEFVGTPTGSSSKGSPVRVNELRRVLSVNENKGRRLSPLRGRLDASNGSIVSSSSESIVSGNFSVSDMDEDGTSLRRQSTRGQSVFNDDGMDTPRASTAVLSGSGSQPERSRASPKADANEIPPVPPLPPNLSIPGCFPNDSQRSLSSGERPTSAPGGKKPFINGIAGALYSRDHNTLDKRKSRSINGLAAEASADDAGLQYLEANGNGEMSDDSDRRDIEKLLDGFLSPDSGGLSNGGALSAMGRDQRRYLGRRGITGGIGRPPY